MIPSVAEVNTLVGALLGDPLLRKFTANKQQPFLEMAYEELTGEMARYHIRKQRRAVVYPLNAGITSLTPATAGISNFGELVKLEERAYGSTDQYTLVTEVDSLPQRDADSRLGIYEWSDDTFNFVGATQAISVRITYYDSGAAPTSGTTGIDGCKNFLAHRTAALAALPAGNVQLSQQYDIAARGAGDDKTGGMLHKIIQAMITSEQKTQMQLPCYQAYSYAGINTVGGLITTGGGGASVGAPSLAVLTGDIDGANATFTLIAIPLRLFLFLNGVLLFDGVGYSLSGSTVTMLPGYIPQSGDSLRAEVW